MSGTQVQEHSMSAFDSIQQIPLSTQNIFTRTSANLSVLCRCSHLPEAPIRGQELRAVPLCGRDPAPRPSNFHRQKLDTAAIATPPHNHSKHNRRRRHPSHREHRTTGHSIWGSPTLSPTPASLVRCRPSLPPVTWLRDDTVLDYWVKTRSYIVGYVAISLPSIPVQSLPDETVFGPCL